MYLHTIYKDMYIHILKLPYVMCFRFIITIITQAELVSYFLQPFYLFYRTWIIIYVPVYIAQ